MPSIGRFTYPTLSLTESIPLVERIAREFGGSVSRRGFARALGMSERGGRFSALAGALRSWGLVEGRSDLRITQLGFQLASPVSREEAVHARAISAASVPILVELARRFGTRAPDQAHLSLVVEEVTGADRVQIEPHILPIQRVFRDVAHDLANPEPDRPGGHHRPLKRADAASSYEIADETRGEALPGATTTDASEPLHRGTVRLSFAGAEVSLPETPANLDALIVILRARREDISETK